MGARDLKLQKFGISKAKYLELKYFCMQYYEYKEMIQYEMKSKTSDGMPKGSLNTNSPVEQQAIENSRAIDAVNLIEDTVNQIVEGEKMRACLLQAITLGTTYEHMKVPCGRRQFYEARRKFYYMLSKKR